MSDEMPENPSPIELSLETTEFSVAPGGSLIMPVVLVYHGEQAAYIELSVGGIPTSWLQAPTVVRQAMPGERQEAPLTIQAPEPPYSHAGQYPFVVRAVVQGAPDQQAEARGVLTVAALQVQGRISLLMESTRFAVAPGRQIEVAVVLLNQGLVEDYLSLTVEGIPAGWITAPAPVSRVAPGEQREVRFSILPPRKPQTEAGRRRFMVQFLSREAPGELFEAPCTLTVGAFTGFRSDLTPDRFEAGETALISVTNQGNVQDVFTISHYDPEGDLAFEPPEPMQLSVPAGQTGTATFRAEPARPRWLGGEKLYPFTTQIHSTGKEVETLSGEVIAKGVIPVWVLPLFLLLCLAAVCVGIIFWYGNRGSESANATQTAALIQTAALTETIAANQTQAAISGQRDSDGDGLTDAEEAQLGTNPNNPDTDADSLLDGEEVKTHGTNPLNPDTDADGLNDAEELRIYRTDPLNPDSDGDGLSDGEEVLRRKTNPKNPDTDDDRLNDGREVQIGTDPLRPDTDNDRLLDGQENLPCPNPLDPDTDRDGIIDGLDLDPCDPSNPSLTATAIAGLPTATTPPTAAPPTQPPPTWAPPTQPPTQPPATDQPQPINGTIAFASNRDGAVEVYAAMTSAANAVRLTIQPGVDTQPAYSPDGGRIAFTSNREGNNEIYVMNADGTAQVNISNNPTDDQEPAWSPDGQWIAFSSNRTGNREIFIMRADGSDVQNLTNHPADDYDPTWFNDRGLFVVTGEWIAFTSTRDGNQEVYLMDADGDNPRNLTNSPANDFAPAGEPGGTHIVFTTDRTGNQEIFRMNTEGKNLSNLSNNPAQDQNPTWSSNGDKIAFTSNRAGNNDIFVMDPNGSNPFNFTVHPADENFPAWH